MFFCIWLEIVAFCSGSPNGPLTPQKPQICIWYSRSGNRQFRGSERPPASHKLRGTGGGPRPPPFFVGFSEAGAAWTTTNQRRLARPLENSVLAPLSSDPEEVFGPSAFFAGLGCQGQETFPGNEGFLFGLAAFGGKAENMIVF